METINKYYSEIDKSNFYLGLISQVYRENSVIQVENLSLLEKRKIKMEYLLPSTINYFVIIDSAAGLFIGQIYYAKVNSSDSVHNDINLGRKEKVYPELAVDIIGVLGNKEKFELAGFKTVGVTDKVYIANSKLLEKYISSIELNQYFSKKDGKEDNKKFLPQQKLKDIASIDTFGDVGLSLQPNTLFDRHLLAIGTTNSGKSTSALKIIDSMMGMGHKVLVIDPTGEFKNTFKDKQKVQQITLGVDAKVSVGEISLVQWSEAIGTNDSTQPAVLADAIKSLRYQFKEGLNQIYIKKDRYIEAVEDDMNSVCEDDVQFNLNLLAKQVSAETRQVDRNHKQYEAKTFNFNSNQYLVQKIESLLNNTTFLEFFSGAPSDSESVDSEQKNLFSELDKFVMGDKSLYIDASQIGVSDNIGTMIVDLISSRLINMDKPDKPYLMYIDEVHRYIDKINASNSGLVAIAREGRKKGVFLFLTTQSPKDVPEILLAQVGTLLIHRITHSEELKIIQNMVQPGSIAQIKNLNQGEAILSSINLIRDIHVRFKKSLLTHDNDTPTF